MTCRDERYPSDRAVAAATAGSVLWLADAHDVVHRDSRCLQEGPQGIGERFELVVLDEGISALREAVRHRVGDAYHRIVAQDTHFTCPILWWAARGPVDRDQQLQRP